MLAGLEEQCGDSLYMKFDRVDACPVLIRISLDGASRQVARRAERQTGIGRRYPQQDAVTSVQTQAGVGRKIGDFAQIECQPLHHAR